MSRLVTPCDLRCFATCERTGETTADCRAAVPKIELTGAWCVLDAWKACAACRHLIKAEVALPHSADQPSDDT